MWDLPHRRNGPAQGKIEKRPEERHNVRDLMARKANTPAAANNLARMIRILMRFAIDEGWRKDDPTLGIKMLKIKSDGFHCWTYEELETFERHWPIGLGRQNIAQGFLTIVQHKTKARLTIPVHPDLQRIIDATPSGNLTLLCTSYEHPFTVHQIASWSGHKTLKEVERYTKAADQKRLAESAMNISVAKLGVRMAKRGVNN
jgi:hypothetical protein